MSQSSDASSPQDSYGVRRSIVMVAGVDRLPASSTAYTSILLTMPSVRYMVNWWGYGSTVAPSNWPFRYSKYWMCSGAVTVSEELAQKTIASVAPSMTPPQNPGGGVGGSWSVASAAGVVTAYGSLSSDQLPAESRARTLNA